MDEKSRKKWEVFLNGHWQKEIPQKAGEYPTKSVDDYAGGLIVVYIDRDTKRAKSTKSWGGYYWSEPLPSLPDVKYED